MRLKIKAANTGGRKEMVNAVVTDEECQNQNYCPLCRIDKPTLKIFVRGLCRRLYLGTWIVLAKFFIFKPPRDKCRKLCVPLESRCDKTVDCGDGSD